MEKPICRWRSFLKDVMICSLGAYGGPEAHFGVFLDQMVVKRRHLEEEELKRIRAIRISLKGVNAVAAGLVAVAAVILLKAGDTTPEHALATLATVGLLFSRKIPAPLIVLAALLAGLL